MAKKKFIDLKSHNIQYTDGHDTFTLHVYNQISMTVTVYSLREQTTHVVPFAHLPKQIKKLINPK
jgi:hypothetical protein